jgi:galactose mutarotase-like enzyme
MYFGIGGHPGFRIPIREGESFEDYYLDFQKPCHPIRIGFTEASFVSGEETPYPLQKNKYLPLSHELFDQEIILLKQSAKQIQFRNQKGKDGVMVSCPDMPYIGIWHKDHTNAPYVCIEPWASLPARDGSKVDLEQQADLIRLEARGIYTNRWSIRV